MKWYKKIFRVSVKDLIKRFPLALVSAITAASVMSYFTLAEPNTNEQLYFTTIFTALIGVIVFAALGFLAQRQKLTGAKYYLTQLAGFLPLAAFFFSALPSDLNIAFSGESVTLFILLMFASAAFIMIAPYIRQKNELAFWQFNKWLFLRGFLAFFSAVVLYAAFALAMFSVETLFNVDINEDYYFVLWQWIAFVYTTAFVLLGAREDLKEHDDDKKFPEIVRKFTFFILSPILVVYFLIIYAYLAKILFIIRQFPDGGVGLPVIIYSSVVIISMLLTYPWYIKEKTHKSAKTLKYIFYSLVPALPMYFIAMGIRIGEYGVTYMRYLGILVGIWFTFIMIYALVKKFKDIKMFFTAALVLLILASFGPWNVFNTTERSQAEQFLRASQIAGVMTNQRTFDLEKFNELTWEEAQRVRDIARYLDRTRSLERVKHIFQKADGSQMTEEEILRALDISFRVNKTEAYTYFNLHAVSTETDPIDISQYNTLIRFGDSYRAGPLYTDDNTLLIMKEDGTLELTHNDLVASAQVSELFRPYVHSDDKNFNESQEPLKITLSGDQLKALVILEAATGRFDDANITLDYGNGLILFKAQ